MKNKDIKFDQNLNTFIDKISSLHEILPTFQVVLKASKSLATLKKRKFLRDNGEVLEEDEKKIKYKLSDMNSRKVYRMDKNRNRMNIASTIIPDKFLISYVSDYDAFIGGLIREMLINKPELMNADDKILAFSILKNLNSINDAFEYLVSKEIESVLRKSHSEQFRWLENICNVKLNKDLDSWGTFVELTERRNLLVHADGIVSSQYIENCKKVDSSMAKGFNLGDKAEVSKEYLDTSYYCLYEIAVKLTQVIWRKLFPNDINNADISLINITFSLLHDEEYILAQELLNFGVNVIRNHSNDALRRNLVINYAQSYYHTNNKKKCIEILNKEDWSSCADNFKLCNEVLRENYNKASDIMLNIGNKGSITEADYLDWPIFKNFKKSEEFTESFKSIFNKEPFIETEELDKDKIDKIHNDFSNIIENYLKI